MELNKDFFKKYQKTLIKKFFKIYRGADKATMEFLGRLPRVEDVRFWLRKNAFLKKIRSFFIALYQRLVVRGEYTRRDLILLFVIAFSVGVAWKTLATRFITIGFEDYTLPPKETLLNLNDVQKKLSDQGSTFIKNTRIEGKSCSE